MKFDQRVLSNYTFMPKQSGVLNILSFQRISTSVLYMLVYRDIHFQNSIISLSL